MILNFKSKTIATLLMAFAMHVAYAAQTVHIDSRPGDSAYTPTKLEWAALELQAGSGSTVMTHESPLMITFLPESDGVTITCILQYTSDYQAAALKATKDSIQKVVAIYKKSRGWNWLKLKFEETPIKDAWPQ